jgi:HSP20 family molecular chaperone IbpA
MSSININPQITDAVTQSLGGYHSYSLYNSLITPGAWDTLVYSTEFEGETAAGYKIIVSIPGCSKENVSVKYVSCENLVSFQAKSEVEDFKGAYQASYHVPKKFNLDEMQCSLKNGLLTIFAPHGKSSKPKEVKIT